MCSCAFQVEQNIGFRNLYFLQNKASEILLVFFAKAKFIYSEYSEAVITVRAGTLDSASFQKSISFIVLCPLGHAGSYLILAVLATHRLPVIIPLEYLG